MEHIPPMRPTSYPFCPVSGLCEQEEKDSVVLNQSIWDPPLFDTAIRDPEISESR